MNIAEILKNVPKGTKLYSPMFGECEFEEIRLNTSYCIIVLHHGDHYEHLTENGKYYVDDDAECILFPSKENRDWSTFKVETPFNFKPFDKVLVRNEDNEPWVIQFFGYYDTFAENEEPYVCLGNSTCIADTFKQCIPFKGNENLLGHYDKV